MIFESHAHYEDERFDDDRDELLLSLKEKGIGTVVNVGSTLETTKKSIALAEKYDFVYAAAGVHPSEISCLSDEGMLWLKEQAKNKKVAAVGEIGLDYYWDKEEEIKKEQKKWFEKQLRLAEEVNLPVIIHSRDAAEDTMEILKRHCEAFPQKNVRGVIHCYSYSPEMATEFIKMGYYIGVGGVVTFKNAKKLKETVKTIDIKHILVETDCPYMAPSPHRGERNASYYLPYIVEKIAEIKGMTTGEVEKQTEENAENMYRL